MLAIQISGMHRCTKLYPNVNILSLQESLQENISHLLLTYFAFPFSFPALSILQSAEPSRTGKISPFPLLFEHCDSDEISSRKDSFYCTLSCPRHQQREENCFLDNTIFFPTQVLVPLLWSSFFFTDLPALPRKRLWLNSLKKEEIECILNLKSVIRVAVFTHSTFQSRKCIFAHVFIIPSVTGP